ncbi:MAG TPA: efflux RND transporter periplasmic adaptor subunit [Thermoanaerobaculia bacterium]|nr:efflux RND transporter periplasmic adaptor subunit [Thermoanaerobaculia bacterium]
MKWSSAVRGCLLCAALALPACARKSAPPPAEAVPVIAARVERRNVPVEVGAIGHVEAYSTVSVKSQVNGTLDSVTFKEGQNVHRGDVLFRIDPRPFEAALAQARANLARDRAQEKNAAAEVGRYQELVQKDYVTREQYDQVKANADALASTVKASEAAVENAALQLSWCTIASPIDGRTGGLLVHAGNVIKANDDKPLVVINQVRPVYVTFSAPEGSLAEIRQSGAVLPVRAAPPADAAHPKNGSLSFIDNAVDPTTGTITLKGTFANEDESLWPGEFVNVTVVLRNEPGAIVVPSPAVQTGQNGSYVYVIKPDSTVESRPVGIERTQGTLTVVGRGLAPGEQVVTDGQLRLTPGARVEIKKPAEAVS